jgi:hypothetical protein
MCGLRGRISTGTGSAPYAVVITINATPLGLTKRDVDLAMTNTLSHSAPCAFVSNSFSARDGKAAVFGAFTRHCTTLLAFLVLLFSFGNAWAGQVRLAWDANTEPDLAGYRVYYGTSTGNYTASVNVGNVTSATIPNLTDNVTYYFAVVAYNTAAVESLHSDEVSSTVVGNALPVVALTSPTNGGSFNAPATIAIAATASDSDGSIARVEFYNGATKLGEQTTAPYTYTWTNVPAGTYSLTAVAFDNLGASATSAAVSVSVSVVTTNLPPTVAMIVPASGQVTLAWDASPEATGYRVHYGVSSGNYTAMVDTASATTATISNLVGGNTYYFAVSAYSTPQMESALSDEIAYATSATPGGYTAPASITLSATASDSDGTVARVEFYNGATKLGEKTSAPFTFNWTNVPAGNYTLTARAFDDDGAAATSSAVNVSVRTPSALTLTTNGTTFFSPARINFTASVNASIGTIQRVEFYAGSERLGVDSSSPYTLSWADVPPGTYTLTAVAIGSQGTPAATSVPVSVTVNPGGPQSPPPSDFVVPSMTSATRLANGDFQFDVTGPVGQFCEVWVSGDLRMWTLLTSAENTTGTLRIVDPAAGQFIKRFYRVSAEYRPE